MVAVGLVVDWWVRQREHHACGSVVQVEGWALLVLSAGNKVFRFWVLVVV